MVGEGLRNPATDKGVNELNDLYRVKYGKTNGGATAGEWVYYEGDRQYERMLGEILEAKLESESFNGNWTRNWLDMKLASLFKKEQTHDGWYKNKVYSVEKRTPDGWAELKLCYDRPQVWLEALDKAEQD